MAVEIERGCGYRKVGGLYLIGSTGNLISRDRLPVPLIACEVCGERPRFNRGISKIDPLRMFGPHGLFVDDSCKDGTLDAICFPGLSAYLMWVGKEYTPAEFVAEAMVLGISKRIPRMPKGIQRGDWIYLAQQRVTDWHPGEGDAIFFAFQLDHVEKVITNEQASNPAVLKELEEKGIVPFIVPADDSDHNPRAAKESEEEEDEGDE